MSIARTPFRQRGRNLWFQIHKWLGLALLVILIPLSASGSLLVWDDWTDGLVNPQRYAVSASAPALPLSAYADAARGALSPEERIASLDLPHEPGRPVMVTAAKAERNGAVRPGPPARTQLWLDPADARVVDRADSRAGLVRTLHVFHGSLMVPGLGRTIVGWLGVAMLFSSLTGLWLWLPQVGSILRGLRWRRGPLTSGNIHHQIGVWIALPLAILSFTGAYISFPNFFRGVEQAFGAPAPQRGGGAGPDRNAKPLASPLLAPDDVIARARPVVGTKRPASLRWPTEKASRWTVIVEREGVRAQWTVDDRTGAVEAAPLPNAGAARFMRTLHDGTTYNVVWKVIIFVAGLAPAALGITGFIMWLRTRSWRRRAAVRPARA